MGRDVVVDFEIDADISEAVDRCAGVSDLLPDGPARFAGCVLGVQSVFWDLLIPMVVVWTAAVLLGRLGLPRIMGLLVVGVILGPAVLGWIEPSEIIDVLAELGIFFLILHTGVDTEPGEFFGALRISLGVALVGALVPFLVAMGVARKPSAWGASPRSS